MNQETLIILLAFGSISVLVYFVSMLLFKGDGGEKLRSRLQGKTESAVIKKESSSGVGSMLKQIGEAASRPFMPSSREKQSSLQRELAKAGIYSPAALRTVQGAKVIGIALGLIAGYVAGLFLGSMLLFLAVGGLTGYVLPIIWLKMKAKGNQKALEYGLPDALDLMVVCVEAGMTVDSSMQRVGDELALVHPVISREFGIAHMQTRVGMPRAGSAAKPRNADRQCGDDVPVRHAESGRALRDQHRPGPARSRRQLANCPPAQGRGAGRQERRQNELPARVVYLPRHLHRPAGSDRDPAL